MVPIHDYGEIDGQMFMEMRLIEGTDLDSVLKRYGPLTPPRAVAIITQIASALDAAHAAGVMHRDVKPPNILVTRDDFAYLVDFGIASATTDEKLTQLGTAVGTWKYMAPERFSNDEVTYRADIYALACVLHECLTGSPPYRADSASTLVTAHLMDPIPQPSAVRSGIPKAFDAVIARGMAKKPEDRYASAGDLALAAHEALSRPRSRPRRQHLAAQPRSHLARRLNADTCTDLGQHRDGPGRPIAGARGQHPTTDTTGPNFSAALSGCGAQFGPDTAPLPARPTLGTPQRPHPPSQPTHPGVLPSQQPQLGHPPTRHTPTPTTLRPHPLEPTTKTQTQPLAHHRRRRSPGSRPRPRRHRYLNGHGRRRRQQPAGAQHHYADAHQPRPRGRPPLPRPAIRRASC